MAKCTKTVYADDSIEARKLNAAYVDQRTAQSRVDECLMCAESMFRRQAELHRLADGELPSYDSFYVGIGDFKLSAVPTPVVDDLRIDETVPHDALSEWLKARRADEAEEAAEKAREKCLNAPVTADELMAYYVGEFGFTEEEAEEELRGGGVIRDTYRFRTTAMSRTGTRGVSQ